MLINYLSNIRVRETEDKNVSRVEWTKRFTPVNVSDEDVVKLFTDIYQDGLEALKANF